MPDRRPPSPWDKARPARAPERSAARAPRRDAPGGGDGERPGADELRLHGLNACLAAFAARPEALRKVWLRADRMPRLKTVLAWCVQHRLGYRVVEDADLERLSGSEHHEGVCIAFRRRPEPSLDAWLATLRPGPCLALWLGGVGNPHNLGAILRSAAHFGVAGLLLDADDPLALSGSACRVAEGGAEAVPLVRLPPLAQALKALRAAGFETAATVVRGGEDLFRAALPARLVLAMGAEGEGLSTGQADALGRALCIPGSGAVESLNVSAATAVFLGEWRRRHPLPATG